MNEKRFVALGSTHIKDTLTGEEFYAPSEWDLLDLLNEQQSKINSLKMELGLISGEKLFSRRELERKVDEQQAIINEQNEAIEYLKTVIRYTLPNQMVADVFKEIGEEYE